MNKIELNAQAINDWMRDHWTLYSTQKCDEKMLRFLISGQGSYRVVHGSEILYEGLQITQAIAAWDRV